MSWITDFCRATIVITPKGTLGTDGRYTFDGTAVTTKARVSQSRRLIRSPGKDEVISDRQFWAAPTETIAIGDKITWNSENLEVLQIDKPDYLDGSASHIKIWAKTL